MVNWHRNVFSGIEHTPEVAMDARLLVVEDGATAPVPLTWMTAVGLDRNPARRAIAVIPRAAGVEALIGQPGIRVCKPLTPRLVAGAA